MNMGISPRAAGQNSGMATSTPTRAKLPASILSLEGVGGALGAVKEQGFEQSFGFPWSHLHPSRSPWLYRSVGAWLPPSVPSAPRTSFL